MQSSPSTSDPPLSLRRAIRADDFNAVRRILAPSLSPFKECKQNHPDSGQFIDVNKAFKEEGKCLGYPLHLACRLGHVDIVRFLINEAGASIDVFNVKGKTAEDVLMASNICSNDSRIQIWNLCVKIEMNRDLETVLQRNELCHAVFHGDIVRLRVLVEQGVRLDKMYGSNGDSLLHVACRQGHLHVLQYLLVHLETDLKFLIDGVTFDDNMTPLRIACQAGRLDLVECLVNQGHADVNNRESSCYAGLSDTPLHTAVQHRHLDIVRFLVQDARCDVTLQDGDLNAPLFYALVHGMPDIARCILDHGNIKNDCAAVNYICEVYEQNYLQFYCENYVHGDSCFDQVLLQYLADRVTNIDGATLSAARATGNPDVLKIVIKAKRKKEKRLSTRAEKDKLYGS